MIRIVLAATLALGATPALAHEHQPQRADAARKPACTMHHIPAPSGKSIQPAVMRCEEARSLETASNQPAPRERAKSAVD